MATRQARQVRLSSSAVDALDALAADLEGRLGLPVDRVSVVDLILRHVGPDELAAAIAATLTTPAPHLHHTCTATATDLHHTCTTPAPPPQQTCTTPAPPAVQVCNAGVADQVPEIQGESGFVPVARDSHHARARSSSSSSSSCSLREGGGEETTYPIGEGSPVSAEGPPPVADPPPAPVAPPVPVEELFDAWQSASSRNAELTPLRVPLPPGVERDLRREWIRYPHLDAWIAAIGELAATDAETIGKIGLASLGAVLRRPKSDPDGDCILLRLGAGAYRQRRTAAPAATRDRPASLNDLPEDQIPDWWKAQLREDEAKQRELDALPDDAPMPF